MTYYKSLRDRVRQSDTVVVIGAGAVGCEVSGEIKSRYPTKSVILVHARELPLTQAYVSRLRSQVDRTLKKLDVKVIYNALGYDNKDGTVTVQHNSVGNMSSEDIKADVVFTTITPKPNTWFVPSEFKNAVGAIQVRDTFQTLIDPAVFVVGDANDISETKQALHATGNSFNVLRLNVLSVLDGRQPHVKYRTKMHALALTMGKYHSAGFLKLPIFGPTVLPSWLVRKIKGRDMYAKSIVKPLQYD